MTLDVKKSNSSNETPNVMTVGVEKYGLRNKFRYEYLVKTYERKIHVLAVIVNVTSIMQWLYYF
jgi:hypothetical protein